MIFFYDIYIFFFCRNDRYEIHTHNEFQTHMRIKCNIQGVCAYSFRSGKYCSDENPMPVKWSIWNPYRFEFHFATTHVHVNTSKELTEHESEILNRNKISYRFEFISPLIWMYFLIQKECYQNQRDINYTNIKYYFRAFLHLPHIAKRCPGNENLQFRIWKNLSQDLISNGIR